MSAEDRRELVLEAATRAFARGGYAGTTTDAVAKEAGVSQPYVVRIFGTKLELFLQVFGRACQRIEQTFRDSIAEAPFDPDSEEDLARVGLAYGELMDDRDLLRVLMHGFSASEVPEIGELAREGMAAIYVALSETGWSEEQVRDFFAQGMLLNVLLSIGALDTDERGPLADLVASCLPGHD